MQTPTSWPAGWVPADGQAIGAIVYQQVAHFGVFEPPLFSPAQDLSNPVGQTVNDTSNASHLGCCVYGWCKAYSMTCITIRACFHVDSMPSLLSSGAGSQLQDGGGAIGIGAPQ